MSEQTAVATEAVLGDGVLINPSSYEGEGLDPESARLMKATIDWFEGRGPRCTLDRCPRPPRA